MLLGNRDKLANFCQAEAKQAHMMNELQTANVGNRKNTMAAAMGAIRPPVHLRNEPDFLVVTNGLDRDAGSLRGLSYRICRLFHGRHLIVAILHKTCIR